ncbi:M23 family metallopeptidase [Leucobacter allii]|uniref:M23 family metallopeptidase n=1 Tax=Leucobacter allii TaxID=2932247 RepID=UPI001FD0EA1C|nr:M23 family metallopeptidase [Leucobacter allii]UOR00298.1 M23 family metallopeptidase [Leucobacter allii]
MAAPGIAAVMPVVGPSPGAARTGGVAGAAPATPFARPSRPATAAPERRWTPPLGRALDVVGPYRAPPHRYGAGHRGIDLAAHPGETVVAPVAGTVSFSGVVVDRPVLSLRVDRDTVVSLEPVRSALAAGDAVSAGEAVGVVAAGGHCDADCVHLGVRVAGEYANPLRYFRYRPVLLPWDG